MTEIFLKKRKSEVPRIRVNLKSLKGNLSKKMNIEKIILFRLKWKFTIRKHIIMLNWSFNFNNWDRNLFFH